MRLKSKVFCVVIVVALLIISLVGCNYESVITLTDLNLEYTPDGSVSHLTGDKSEELLNNIDRGFRLETYYTLGSGRAWPIDDGSDGYQMLNDEIEFYKEDKAVETQVYIYIFD